MKNKREFDLDKIKVNERKQNRLDMLKDIVNPLDVPGVDIKIFEKIDSLPKDKNMYAIRTIEKYENLKARVNT